MPSCLQRIHYCTYTPDFTYTQPITSAGMVGKQGVAAPCFSYAFYASCIHVVHTSNLLYSRR